MAGPTPWISVGIASAALLVSLLAMLVAYANYRASGARIRITGHNLTIRNGEHWLQVRLVNSGRAEVDVEGAWTDRFGATSSTLPKRLAGGSSIVLLFRSPPSRAPSSAALTVSVDLGDGRAVLKRLPLSESEQGLINMSWLSEVEPDHNLQWGLPRHERWSSAGPARNQSGLGSTQGAGRTLGAEQASFSFGVEEI